jgi:hypothetical protein
MDTQPSAPREGGGMMVRHFRRWTVWAVWLGMVWAAGPLRAQKLPHVAPVWTHIITVSKTTPTLQVVVNPPMRRGTAVHDQIFRSLKQLDCDYVRYVPWLPYPKLGVAELEPPKNGKTSWDFSLIDPMTEDFMDATAGHSVIMNFSTIPQWMFKTPKPVAYPSDPDQVTWDYEQGAQLTDPSMKQVADYYARLVSWYTQGGFTDELGHRHTSNHHYKFQYWEVLNEINGEHRMSAPFYTALYDRITAAVRAVQPGIKFVGMGYGGTDPRFFDYFFDPRHHQPGTPMDMISYHFYAVPGPNEPGAAQQYSFFDQADHFLDVVSYIQESRQRLAPHTATDVDEIGCISADDLRQGEPGHVTRPIPASYWNLCGATYAYVFAGLARRGVEVAGESQLVGYPTQFPSVSLLDWNTGKPNARYWVLKLLHTYFGPGDKLVETGDTPPSMFAQGFETRGGRREVLLINKRDRVQQVELKGASGSEKAFVNVATGEHEPATERLSSDRISLQPFEVAVVALQ